MNDTENTIAILLQNLQPPSFLDLLPEARYRTLAEIDLLVKGGSLDDETAQRLINDRATAVSVLRAKCEQMGESV